jgi:thiol:disulfide interchange protein
VKVEAFVVSSVVAGVAGALFAHSEGYVHTNSFSFLRSFEIVVFVVLGLGMALPYVLLAWFPGWRRRLPRPGPWLERMKEVLAFPLYATVIWLSLGAQRDNVPSRLLLSLLGIGRVVGMAGRAHRLARMAFGRRRGAPRRDPRRLTAVGDECRYGEITASAPAVANGE